jgi:hypothetical protein
MKKEQINTICLLFGLLLLSFSGESQCRHKKKINPEPGYSILGYTEGDSSANSSGSFGVEIVNNSNDTLLLNYLTLSFGNCDNVESLHICVVDSEGSGYNKKNDGNSISYTIKGKGTAYLELSFDYTDIWHFQSNSCNIPYTTDTDLQAAFIQNLGVLNMIMNYMYTKNKQTGLLKQLIKTYSPNQYSTNSQWDFPESNGVLNPNR